MSDVFKIGIAISLALVAAVGNYLYLESQKGSEFHGVRLKSELRMGAPFSIDDFERVPIPGKEEELKKSFLPWANREYIANLPANKPYKSGDVLLMQDLNISKPSWKALGSFRLLSIGERIRTGDRFSEGRDSNSLTIEVELDKDGNYNEKTLRLLDIVAMQSASESRAEIVAIQLDPNPENAPPEDVPPEDSELDDIDETTSIQLATNRRGIIIPLGSVENIPEVLARGSYISFIVRWFDLPNEESAVSK